MSRLIGFLPLKTIGFIIIAAMVSVAVLAGGASYLIIDEIQQISSSWNNLYDTTSKTRTRYQLRGSMGYGGIVHHLKNLYLRRDPTLGDLAITEVERGQKLVDQYRSLTNNPDELASLRVIEQTLQVYSERIITAKKMVSEGASSEAIDQAIKYDDTPAFQAFDKLAAVTDREQELAQTRLSDAVGAAADFAQTIGFIVIAALAVFGAALVLFIRYRLIAPLTALVSHVNRIGDGDLRTRIHLETKDEMNVLGEAINGMTDGLQRLTAHAQEASQQLSSLSSETLAATRQQASSVEEQFASVQEVTATVDEIVQSGEQMSSKAQDIVQQARATMAKGEKGLHSVESMASAMDAIRSQTGVVANNIASLSEHTQAIGDIIASVTDIAQRSELLALNAAIEAAAAGEHGRSFAVVADEIKAMADQSKSATGQVADILRKIHDGISRSVMLTEESVKRVESGRIRSDEALSSITDMTESIQLSIGAFELSVSAINQQKIGLDQVAKALQHIRTGGEQTASGTRQIESAVNNMTALTSQINQSIQGYAA